MARTTRTITTVALSGGVLALLLSVFAYYEHSALGDIEASNEKLLTDIALLQSKAEQRDARAHSLAELQQAIKEYVKILPSGEIATQEKIIAIYADTIEQSGVKLRELSKPNARRAPKPRRGQRRVDKKDFEEIALRFKVEGNYQQLIDFVNAIERHETFPQVRSFQFDKSSREAGNLLVASLTISTFRSTIGN